MPRPLICAVLIDLSGTLHIGSNPTKDAVHGLQRLASSGIPFRFCSNTSKESTEDVVARLRRIGFHIRSRDVWTSVGSIKRHLESAQIRRPYFLLSDSAQEECRIKSTYESSTPYDAVVVGLAPSLLTYDNLNTAFRILKHEHESQRASSHGLPIPLIATHKGKYLESQNGGLSLGPGPFVAALEYAAGVKAEVVGKPTRTFFESVIRDFSPRELERRGSEHGRIAIIGDDIEADLGEGAQELGLWRVLVKTGKYRHGDEHRNDIQSPDEIYETFADWIDSLCLA